MLNRNKLLGAIAEAGYTQRSLAAALGCSKNTVNEKLNGKRQFDLAEVDKLCAILGISDTARKAEIFLT